MTHMVSVKPIIRRLPYRLIGTGILATTGHTTSQRSTMDMTFIYIQQFLFWILCYFKCTVFLVLTNFKLTSMKSLRKWLALGVLFSYCFISLEPQRREIVSEVKKMLIKHIRDL